MNDFQAAARHAGYFASGGPVTFRIAVTGKRMFAAVAQFAASQGATVAQDTGKYPQLMTITIQTEGGQQ